MIFLFDYDYKRLNPIYNFDKFLRNKFNQYFKCSDIYVNIDKNEIKIKNEYYYCKNNNKELMNRILKEISIINMTCSFLTVNEHLLLSDFDELIKYLRFEIDIQKFVSNELNQLILKENELRKGLKNKMDINAKLKGFDYREHIFKNIIIPKYCTYLDEQMNKYFGYSSASKKMAGIIKLDDLLFANINSIGKENMNFLYLIALDNPQTLDENVQVSYNEYGDYLDENNMMIDETHYTFKLVIFPDKNKANEYYNFNKMKYLPMIEETGLSQNEYDKMIEKITKLSDYIQNTILPEMCEMWNKDIDTYIIDSMDESIFNDQ